MSKSSFTLSAYEETKQRMRQLQQEEQKQKKLADAVAAAASAAESTAATASKSSRPASDRAFSYGNRDTTATVTKSSLSTTNGTLQPTPSNMTGAAVTTRTTTVSRSSASSSAASSATTSRRSTLTSTLPSTSTASSPSPPSTNPAAATSRSSTAAAVPPTSSYIAPFIASQQQTRASSATSTRRQNGTSTVATNQVQSTPTHQPQFSPDPSSTGAFSVLSAASPSDSQSNTPKNGTRTLEHGIQQQQSFVSADPLPSITPLLLPTLSSSSSSPLLDRSLFLTKLDSLSTLLQTTAQSLGLKYSLDTRLKLAIQELDSIHSASVRNANDTVLKMNEEYTQAIEECKRIQSVYDSELTKSRLLLQEHKRRLDRTHTLSLNKATKECEALIRGEYLEKAKKFEGVEKYNQEKMKQIEEQVRVQLKLEAKSERQQTKQNELLLQERLQQLEESGLVRMQEKESEIVALKQQLMQVQQTSQDAQKHAKAWEKKYTQAQDVAKKSEHDLAAMRIETSQLKQDNLALIHRLDRMQEESEKREDVTKRELEDVKQQILHERNHAELEKSRTSLLIDSHTAALTAMKQKHLNELDTIQTRIGVVLQKKEDQIAMLKESCRVQTEKVRDIERELNGI